MSEDIRDILDIDRVCGPQVSKEDILGTQTKKKISLPSGNRQTRRPEGMAREVFALLYNDNKDVPPVIETETGKYFLFVYCFNKLKYFYPNFFRSYL